jgi:hypothetical protein
MNDITSSLGILSSMITPAVLILASSSLILTTSTRLSRVIERVRMVAQEFMEVEKTNADENTDEKRLILYKLLHKSARRTLLLTRAMILLYISLGLFVATSLAIGIIAITQIDYTWVPTALGLVGAICLFLSSAILIVESRLTLSVVKDELQFVIQYSKSKAPISEELKRDSFWQKWFGIG